MKLQQKKSKYGKICIGTYLWCLHLRQSSEFQPTHGKGRGSTILTKQNKLAMQEKQQCEKKNNGNMRKKIEAKLTGT